MGTQFLQHQNGSIAYDDSGSGPLVVCAPSMGDLRSEYRFLIPQLVAAGYRAVSLDVRGHGETSTEWPDYSVAGGGERSGSVDPPSECRAGSDRRHLDVGRVGGLGSSRSTRTGIGVGADRRFCAR